MATLLVPPSPATPSSMSGRRTPLSSNPNAVNSPYRAVPVPAASKAKRSHATLQREESYGQPPPKKQMLDTFHASRASAGRYRQEATAPDGVNIRQMPASHQPTHTEHAKIPTRQRSNQPQVTRAERVSEESVEHVKQWRKHYRNLFPNFVFYFENISEDTKSRCLKFVSQLGAVSDFRRRCMLWANSE